MRKTVAKILSLLLLLPQEASAQYSARMRGRLSSALFGIVLAVLMSLALFELVATMSAIRVGQGCNCRTFRWPENKVQQTVHSVRRGQAGFSDY
jgi:hypothetical protein